LEVPLQGVFENVSAKIPDMRAAVNGWSAGVHADRSQGLIAGLKFFDLARVGIKKTRCHQRGRDGPPGRPLRLRRARRSRPTSTVAIAIVAISSPRPIGPSRSLVVALMLMIESATPIAAAIFSRMAEICGAIFGASAIIVASMLITRAFLSESSSVTRCKILMLLMPW